MSGRKRKITPSPPPHHMHLPSLAVRVHILQCNTNATDFGIDHVLFAPSRVPAQEPQ